ncbi:MAG: RNA polymerase sigma factor [Acidimicrobiales bacterium]
MVAPFERVVQEHGATVYRVCAAVVGPDEAEDAWVETWLAALRAYPGLRADSDLRAWLVTIAHRKAIDMYRARARRAVPLGDLPELAGMEDRYCEADPSLYGLLRALPDKQRLAVAYRYLGDLSYADVAALLGSNEAAARRAAADGIAALRRRYQPASLTEEAR